MVQTDFYRFKSLMRSIRVKDGEFRLDFRNLDLIDLTKNEFETFRGYANVLSKAIRQNKKSTLKKVLIYYDYFQHLPEGKKLLDAIGSLYDLEYIDIRYSDGNQTSTNQVPIAHVSKLLQNSKYNVISIDLWNCELISNVSDEFEGFLATLSSCRCLKRVGLYSAQYSAQPQQDPTKRIGKFIKTLSLLPRLEVLIMNNMRICDEDGYEIAASLQFGFSGLKRLMLTENTCSHSANTIIAYALSKRRKSVTEFSLGSNNVNLDSCFPLSLLTNLTCLDLSCNNIGDNGCLAIAESLLKDKNTSIEILQLWKCNISDKGCHSLANILQTYNRSLICLNLAYNDRITHIGSKALIKAVKQNFVIKTVNIPGNSDSEMDFYLTLNKYDRKKFLSNYEVPYDQFVDNAIRSQKEIESKLDIEAISVFYYWFRSRPASVWYESRHNNLEGIGKNEKYYPQGRN